MLSTVFSQILRDRFPLLGYADIPVTVNVNNGVNPAPSNLGTVISNAITIAFIVAALVVLFFLILGAFQWITSGGDKERINKARGTIVSALIGLAILALALLIVNVVSTILNIPLISSFSIPTL